MKTVFKIFVIISFIGIAVFGFAAMNHNSEHGAVGCIAAAVKAIDCKDGANAFNLALFHLDAFKDFSNATVSGNFTGALLLLFVFVFLGGVWRGMRPLIALLRLVPCLKYEKYLELFFSPQKITFNRWLSLHENSPSVFA